MMLHSEANNSHARNRKENDKIRETSETSGPKAQSTTQQGVPSPSTASPNIGGKCSGRFNGLERVSRKIRLLEGEVR